jgi:hypothetical protein
MIQSHDQTSIELFEVVFGRILQKELLRFFNGVFFFGFILFGRIEVMSGSFDFDIVVETWRRLK